MYKRPTLKSNLVSILALVFAVIPLTAATNLLENGGFEDPINERDRSGWERRGPKGITLTQVASPLGENQQYALKVDGRSSKKWEGVKQDVDLEPGKPYLISGLIVLLPDEEPDNFVVQLIIERTDGSKKFQVVVRGPVTGKNWLKFGETFVIKETDIRSIQLSVHGLTPGKAFVIDEFSLVAVE